jgi:hypothetical protein
MPSLHDFRSAFWSAKRCSACVAAWSTCLGVAPALRNMLTMAQHHSPDCPHRFPMHAARLFNGLIGLFCWSHGWCCSMLWPGLAHSGGVHTCHTHELGTYDRACTVGERAHSAWKTWLPQYPSSAAPAKLRGRLDVDSLHQGHG